MFTLRKCMDLNPRMRVSMSKSRAPGPGPRLYGPYWFIAKRKEAPWHSSLPAHVKLAVATWRWLFPTPDGSTTDVYGAKLMTDISSASPRISSTRAWRHNRALLISGVKGTVAIDDSVVNTLT